MDAPLEKPLLFLHQEQISQRKTRQRVGVALFSFSVSMFSKAFLTVK
jgi:hypothetical protein